MIIKVLNLTWQVLLGYLQVAYTVGHVTSRLCQISNQETLHAVRLNTASEGALNPNYPGENVPESMGEDLLESMGDNIPEWGSALISECMGGLPRNQHLRSGGPYWALTQTRCSR
jgi:hypothetical protein